MRQLGIKKYDFDLYQDPSTKRYEVIITKGRNKDVITKLPAINMFSKNISGNPAKEDLSIIKCASFIKAVEENIIKTKDIEENRVKIMRNGKVSVDRTDIHGIKYSVDLISQTVSNGTETHGYQSMAILQMIAKEESQIEQASMPTQQFNQALQRNAAVR